MRCAPLGPTPGSRASSSMRSWTGPSYIGRLAEPRQPERRPEPPGDRAHRVGLQLLSLAARVVDRGDDEVFERLDVVGVDDTRVDVEAQHVTGARGRDRDQPATGRTFDL